MMIKQDKLSQLPWRFDPLSLRGSCWQCTAQHAGIPCKVCTSHDMTSLWAELLYESKSPVCWCVHVCVWVSIPRSGPVSPSPAVGTRCFALSQHALGGCEHCHTHTDASTSDCRIQALRREREATENIRMRGKKRQPWTPHILILTQETDKQKQTKTTLV